MKKRPTTAVVLAAGKGTRRLPITRCIDKAMLPIVNRPVVDYLFEQCADVGIENIVCLVGKEDTLIRQHYGESIEISREFPWLHKTGTMHVTYVFQPAGGKYGTGAALEYIAGHVDHSEPFLTLFADAFISAEQNPLEQLIGSWQKSDSAIALLGLWMIGSDAKHYSVIETDRENHLLKLTEKPEDLSKKQWYRTNVSFYILNGAVLDELPKLEEHDGEYYLLDAVEAVAKQDSALVVPLHGVFCDAGTTLAWHQANEYMLNLAKLR